MFDFSSPEMRRDYVALRQHSEGLGLPPCPRASTLDEISQISDVGLGCTVALLSLCRHGTRSRRAAAGGLSSIELFAVDVCQQRSKQGVCWKWAGHILSGLYPGLSGSAGVLSPLQASPFLF